MSLLSKIGDFVGGGLFKEVKSLVQDYFPPDMSPQQRAELEIKLQEIAASKEIQASRLILEAEQALTQRITQLEGSAQDLRAVPLVGPLVIFLRGLQRPLWGYAVLYIDFMWFSGKWSLEGQQESAMWVINLLVLGFLFGERAVQNLAPLISELISKKKGG
jgi:hypothetical protein